ncbi:fumarylacetoacetate hydrolase family protein [Candidatus Poribacteria bacterium]|nr:fumarylacetoacetate hydrolase family protein [Candidatus Poribacteria bacterium]
MRLVSFQGRSGTHLGIEVDGRVVDAARTYLANIDDDGGLALTTMQTLLDAGDAGMAAARRVHDLAAASPAKAHWTTAPIAAPVPRAPKLLCLAGNYAEHIREGGGEAPEKKTTTPRVFMKPPGTTTIAHGEAIVIPRYAGWIDWEGELAVVIGKRGKYIAASDALDYVAGYTILNDVSERNLLLDREREPREGDRWFDWLNGKWLDTFAPMGPCLVTRDEVANPDDLLLTLRVNGVEKQRARTSEMIFTCAELVAWITRHITLEPGDVISTGTPSGVGKARGEKLAHGDVVDVEIEGIGVLSNPVVREA